MPSSNKTTLGLNLWSGTDKPKKNDFNADNRIIDAALAGKTGVEYGEWIPSIVGATVAGNPTYSVRTGAYRKIDGMCFCFCRVGITRDANASGDIRITGLPFVTYHYAPVIFSYQSNTGITSPLSGYVQSNLINIGYTNPSTGNYAGLAAATIGNLQLMCSVAYPIA